MLMTPKKVVRRWAVVFIISGIATTFLASWYAERRVRTEAEYVRVRLDAALSKSLQTTKADLDKRFGEVNDRLDRIERSLRLISPERQNTRADWRRP